MAARDFLRNNWPAVTIAVTAACDRMRCVRNSAYFTSTHQIASWPTGSEGGAYSEIGKRYRAALESAGVEVQLVPTAGSLGQPRPAAQPKVRSQPVGLYSRRHGRRGRSVRRPRVRLEPSSTNPCGFSIGGGF